MTHLGFHPAQGWTTGQGPWQEGGPPPLWITITVPDAWREEMGSHAIGIIGQAVRRFDRARGHSRDGGDVWVNVIGVADGCIGRDGVPSTAEDVVLFMTEEHRANPEEADLPEGSVADPICGMAVKLGPNAITLTHGDNVVGFCSQGCRRAYAGQHELEVPAA